MSSDQAEPEPVKTAQVVDVHGNEYEAVDIPVVMLNIRVPNRKEPVCVEAAATDVIFEIRHYLSEIPETCDITSYHFEFNNQKINDFATLSSYPDLLESDDKNVPKDVHIVVDSYDERSAKEHIRRFRDVLVNPPAFNKNINFMAEVTSETTALTDFNKAMAEAKKRLLSKKPLPKNASRNAKRNAKTVTKEPEEASLVPALTVNEFFNVSAPEVPQCVRNVSFSSWNPVPSHRRLLGDLFYLDITTTDDKRVCVTAAVDGFFLNHSTTTHFDPSPVDITHKSHSLSALLSRVSPSFATQWNKLLNRKVTCHQLDLQTATTPTPSWAAVPTPHKCDWNRADDAAQNLYGMDIRASMRDWNDEFQSARALPRAQPQERMMRDRTWTRIQSDFIEAATKGAVAVVDGNIVPINPMEHPRSHLYMFNNIFFSVACDVRNANEQYGGDRTSHKNAKNDLVMVKTLTELDLDSVNFIPTVIVDYRGVRVVAQGLIPGIFTPSATTNVAGSINAGANYSGVKAAPEDRREEVTAAFSSLAEALHTKSRTLKGTEDEEAVEALLGADVKSMLASDGRVYVLDLMHALPRDVNFPENEDSGCVIRPEALRQYCRARAFKALVTGFEEEKKEEEARKKAAEEKGETVPEKTAEEVAAANKKRKKAYFAELHSIRFNPDLYTAAEQHLCLSEEEKEADRAKLRELAAFLKDDIIPATVQSMLSSDKAPADGSTLVESLHESGINVRYLGHIATLTKPPASDDNNADEAADKKQKPSINPAAERIHRVAVNEMVTRAAKTLFNTLLRGYHAKTFSSPLATSPAALIASFLSALLGKDAFGASASPERLSAAEKVVAHHAEVQLLREKAEIQAALTNDTSAVFDAPDMEVPVVADAPVPTDALDTVNVWAAVRRLVQRKYQYELPAVASFTDVDRLAVLRSLCVQVGVQVVAKEYDFTITAPVAMADVLALEPVVSKCWPVSHDATAVATTAKSLLARGAVEDAFHFFNEGVNLTMQTSGTIAPSLADSYTHLGRIFVALDDFEAALDVVYRSIVILQKTYGYDHIYVAAAHNQLAQTLVLCGKPLAAVKHLRRVLFIVERLFGSMSMETVFVHLNMALALFHGTKVSHCVAHLTEAADRANTVYGADSPILGPIYECLGLMCYYNHAFSQAATALAKCYNITAARVPEDQREQHSELNKYKGFITRFHSLAEMQAKVQQGKATEDEKKTLMELVKESEMAKDAGILVQSFWGELRSMTVANNTTIQSMLDAIEDENVLSKQSSEEFLPYHLGAMNQHFKKKEKAEEDK